MSAAAEIRDVNQGPAAAPARRPRPDDFDPSPPHAILFWALMFFFFLEFLRPPVLSQLKYQMLFVSLVPILWLTSKDRPWSPILTMQWLMLGQAAISILYGVNYFAAYTGARTMWPNVVSGLAIFWILSREKSFVRGIWVWALIISYQAFFAFSIGGGRGSGGILGDENDLAMACTMAVPFMLMSMQLLRGLSRALALGLLVLLLVGIVASESRGGFVGLAGAVAYCLFYSANRARNFAIIALGGLIFFLSIPSEYKDELGSISETKSGTAEARFFLWTAGTNMWIDNPVLGVGALNSPWLIGDYQPKAEDNGGMFSDRGYRERDWTMTPMHSIYFEILAETGLVGIGLFGNCVWLHFAVIGRTRKRTRLSRAADADLKRDAELYGVSLAGAMIAFLVCGLFLSILYYPFFYYFTALAAAYDAMIMRRLNFAEALAGWTQAQRLEAGGVENESGGRSPRGEAVEAGADGRRPARPEPGSAQAGLGGGLGMGKPGGAGAQAGGAAEMQPASPNDPAPGAGLSELLSGRTPSR